MPSNVSNEEAIGGYTPIYKQLEGYEPFEKVQRNVEEKIMFDRRSKVINGLRAKLMQQAEFGKTGEFVDFCLEKIYQMSKQ